MAYRNDIPVETNTVRGVSGDLALMKTNYAVLASVVSGMTAPSEAAPMSHLMVTSGAQSFGLGWSGTDGALTYSGAVVATLNGTHATISGLVLRGDQPATADDHYMRQGDMASPPNFIEVLGGHIVTVTSGAVFALDERAMYGYDIVSLHAQTASGTANVTAKIGAATVSGLDAVTISGAQTSHVATDAFTVVSGNRVTLTMDSTTGDPSDLSFTIKLVRT